MRWVVSHALTGAGAAAAAVAVALHRRQSTCLLAPTLFRLQRLSLVCKQWHELCGTPSLIRQVAVKETGDGAHTALVRSHRNHTNGLRESGVLQCRRLTAVPPLTAGRRHMRRACRG